MLVLVYFEQCIKVVIVLGMYVAIPQVCTNVASCGFSVAAPQSGTLSLLVFVLVGHYTHSVIVLKSTVLNGPLVPVVAHTSAASDLASGQHCTKYFITYILTLFEHTAQHSSSCS